MRRIYGEPRELSADEIARYDAVKAEYDKLDAEYAEAEDDDEEVEDRLEKLGAELDALNDRPSVYDPDEVARAGVFVTLGANGRLRIERGFIRPEDEPAAGAEDGEPDEQRGIDDANGEPVSGVVVNGRPANDGSVEEEEDETIKPLPDRLVFDLTAQRTLALRNALAADPALAFTAALHAFVLQVFYRFASDTCLEISLKSASFSQVEGLGETVWAKEIDERHQNWDRDLPKDEGELWEFLIGLDEASRQALFAHCVSLSLNAVMEPWNKRPRALAHADILARTLRFDMVSAGWVPTVDNYLGRVTKARILEAVREAKGEDSAERIDHLKKDDMAREAARLLEGSNWLPEPLRQAAATRFRPMTRTPPKATRKRPNYRRTSPRLRTPSPRTSLRRLNSANPNPNDQKSPAATPGYFHGGRTNVGRPHDNAAWWRHPRRWHRQASRSAQRRPE